MHAWKDLWACSLAPTGGHARALAAVFAQGVEQDTFRSYRLTRHRKARYYERGQPTRPEMEARLRFATGQHASLALGWHSGVLRMLLRDMTACCQAFYDVDDHYAVVCLACGQRAHPHTFSVAVGEETHGNLALTAADIFTYFAQSGPLHGTLQARSFSDWLVLLYGAAGGQGGVEEHGRPKPYYHFRGY